MKNKLRFIISTWLMAPHWFATISAMWNSSTIGRTFSSYWSSVCPVYFLL